MKKTIKNIFFIIYLILMFITNIFCDEQIENKSINSKLSIKNYVNINLPGIQNDQWYIETYIYENMVICSNPLEIIIELNSKNSQFQIHTISEYGNLKNNLNEIETNYLLLTHPYEDYINKNMKILKLLNPDKSIWYDGQEIQNFIQKIKNPGIYYYNLFISFNINFFRKEGLYKETINLIIIDENNSKYIKEIEMYLDIIKKK